MGNGPSDGENSRDEIERFKQEINLVEYAASQGYTLDPKESFRHSKVLRDSGGDKIIITTDRDNHGIYFSVRDDRDSGTIIDFVQRRKSLNLGQVRQELRSWIGETRHQRPVPRILSKPEKSSSDRQKMLLAFSRTHIPKRHTYLQNERCISARILSDERFLGAVRQDQRGNVVFPHYDMKGLCGYELKNKDFTGFSPGGVKGVWISTNMKSAKTVVMVEAAIDALSHAQLCRTDKDTAYISVGGQLSRQQEELIRNIMQRAHERGSQFIVAPDKDDAGHTLARLLKNLAPRNADIKRSVPIRYKDWNEQLKAYEGFKRQYKQQYRREYSQGFKRGRSR